MTTPIDPFERRLPDALADLASARTPDYLIDILGQTARKRQRPAWATPGRWNPMTGFASRPAIAMMITAVLVILVGGGILLDQRNQAGVGGAGVAPSPTAATTPTAAPSPSASPSPTPIVLSVNSTLAAGAHRIAAPFTAPFTVTFASDWTVTALEQGLVAFATPGDNTTNVEIHLVDNVYADPCQAASGPKASPPPTTVDGLLAALSKMVGFRVGPVTDAVIAGHPAKVFDLSNTVDTATAGCSGGRMLPLWTVKGGASPATNGGTSTHMGIIDLGGRPVVIVWASDPGSEAIRLEVEQVVKTLAFE